MKFDQNTRPLRYYGSILKEISIPPTMCIIPYWHLIVRDCSLRINSVAHTNARTTVAHVRLFAVREHLCEIDVFRRSVKNDLLRAQYFFERYNSNSS